MTGIERLREFAEGISPFTVVCGVTTTSYDRKHTESIGVRLRDFLSDIAGQIERETKPKSDAVKYASVSAYDPPSQEEREAAAWVREHGGLDRVRELLDWVVGHCSTERQLDFDFWLSGRVMHELGFEEDMADRDEVERRLLARLMPEGYEWPMVDGKPLEAGQTVYAKNYGYVKCTVLAIEWVVDGYLVEVENEGGHKFRQTPDEFTHERSVADTWERLEEEARSCTCVMEAIDLVRRAKKLAGVSE